MPLTRVGEIGPYIVIATTRWFRNTKRSVDSTDSTKQNSTNADASVYMYSEID